MINSVTAYEKIKNSYDMDSFKAIARDGPDSGTASKHIDIKENAFFFNENQAEILEFITNELGEEQIEEMETEEGIPLRKEDKDTLLLYKNALNLTFIDLIAFYVTSEN